jgi:hypothetical protein
MIATGSPPLSRVLGAKGSAGRREAGGGEESVERAEFVSSCCDRCGVVVCGVYVCHHNVVQNVVQNMCNVGHVVHMCAIMHITV